MKRSLVIFIAASLLSTVAAFGQSVEQVSITPLRLDKSRPGRYARSLMTPDSTIHLLGLFEITERGSRVRYVGDKDPVWGGASLTEAYFNTFFVRPDLFIGLKATVEPASDGTYRGTMWRSLDGMQTLNEEEFTLILPEAGKVDFGSPEIWAGIFFHRAIVESTDGSLLAAMYGNFEQDTARPTHPWSITETKFKLRTFVVRSTDRGKTWRYVSSVTISDQEKPDDSEGFNEWTIARLEDGRLLGIIRTGHFTPMVACWSGDEGHTWTEPLTMDRLGPAGVDPCMIRLSDGRLALSYGEMVQPTAGQLEGDETKRDTRRRCRLAISEEKVGELWRIIDVSDYDDRSAYSTIFEVEPGVLLYQADLQLWRIEY